jgi:hypothetical protein
VTKAQKIWGTFQALGNIAFAYSYSQILIEIQVYLFSLIILIKPVYNLRCVSVSLFINIFQTLYLFNVGLVFLNNMHMCISIRHLTKY